MNTIEYKGYVGKFGLEPGDEMFHGQVLGILDVVHFRGRSVEELRQDLADAVDDYLEACASIGKTPEKPYSGKILLRLPEDAHRLADQAAALSGKSLNAFMVESVEKAAKEVVRR